MILQQAFDHLGYSRELQNDIRQSYSENHRVYHNLDHLSGILRWVDSDMPGSDLAVVLESILFHDIVYLTEAVPPGLNEALSIAWFVAIRQGDVCRDRELRVVEAINATAWHATDQRHLSCTSQIVLDLDLQSFALPWDEYVRDADLVIREFAPILGYDASYMAACNF